MDCFEHARCPRRRALCLGLAALLAGLPAAAAPPINTLQAGLPGGRAEVAILGYDPVAYFVDGRAVKGDPSHTYAWRGARWQFATASHLQMFRSDPQKYAPQYGGYCAYGVSQGQLVGVEPDQFKILDGKLYLNYDADVQALWLKDPAAYIKQADARFETLLGR